MNRPVVEIWVPGVPIAKQRPRVTITRRGRVYAYTPRETREWEQVVGWEARRHWTGDPHEGPLEIWLEFYFPRPRRGRSPWPLVDVDNAGKAVLDGLKGVVYPNDVQVVKLHISKAFGDEPGVSIRIAEADAAASA